MEVFPFLADKSSPDEFKHGGGLKENIFDPSTFIIAVVNSQRIDIYRTLSTKREILSVKYNIRHLQETLANFSPMLPSNVPLKTGGQLVAV